MVQLKMHNNLLKQGQFIRRFTFMLNSIKVNQLLNCPLAKRYASTMIKLSFIILVLIFSYPSHSCSPAIYGKQESLKVQTKKSFELNDLIVLAYVTKIERRNLEVNTRFKVLHAYKGHEKVFETGWNAECCLCNMQFDEGKTYIVHAKKYKEGYWISEFGLTIEYPYLTAKQLKYLQKYSK